MAQVNSNLVTKARNIISLKTFREKLLEAKINSFEPKVVFLKDFKNYRVMTASFPSDLKKILKLRHDIFVKDLERRAHTFEVDFDRYDLMGDHIMIINKETDEVIGTYRVMASQFSKKFYSETEFEMESLKRAPGHKIELGRACIHRHYRKGMTLHLIWRGLAHYIKLVQAQYLFGCSSIFTQDPVTIQQTLGQFTQDQWGTDFSVEPRRKYSFDQNFELAPNPQGAMGSPSLIPPLLQSYLGAGAKVYGQPAWDRDFGCIDVFTVLNMQKITPRYHAKYFEES